MANKNNTPVEESDDLYAEYATISYDYQSLLDNKSFVANQRVKLGRQGSLFVCPLCHEIDTLAATRTHVENVDHSISQDVGLDDLVSEALNRQAEENAATVLSNGSLHAASSQPHSPQLQQPAPSPSSPSILIKVEDYFNSVRKKQNSPNFEWIIGATIAAELLFHRVHWMIEGKIQGLVGKLLSQEQFEQTRNIFGEVVVEMCLLGTASGNEELNRATNEFTRLCDNEQLEEYDEESFYFSSSGTKFNSCSYLTPLEYEVCNCNELRAQLLECSPDLRVLQADVRLNQALVKLWEVFMLFVCNEDHSQDRKTLYQITARASFRVLTNWGTSDAIATALRSLSYICQVFLLAGPVMSPKLANTAAGFVKHFYGPQGLLLPALDYLCRYHGVEPVPVDADLLPHAQTTIRKAAPVVDEPEVVITNGYDSSSSEEEDDDGELSDFDDEKLQQRLDSIKQDYLLNPPNISTTTTTNQQPALKLPAQDQSTPKLETKQPASRRVLRNNSRTRSSTEPNPPPAFKMSAKDNNDDNQLTNPTNNRTTPVKKSRHETVRARMLQKEKEERKLADEEAAQREAKRRKRQRQSPPPLSTEYQKPREPSPDPEQFIIPIESRIMATWVNWVESLVDRATLQLSHPMVCEIRGPDNAPPPFSLLLGEFGEESGNLMKKVLSESSDEHQLASAFFPGEKDAAEWYVSNVSLVPLAVATTLQLVINDLSVDKLTTKDLSVVDNQVLVRGKPVPWVVGEILLRYTVLVRPFYRHCADVLELDTVAFDRLLFPVPDDNHSLRKIQRRQLLEAIDHFAVDVSGQVSTSFKSRAKQQLKNPVTDWQTEKTWSVVAVAMKNYVLASSFLDL